MPSKNHHHNLEFVTKAKYTTYYIQTSNNKSRVKFNTGDTAEDTGTQKQSNQAAETLFYNMYACKSVF